jgi:ABC-type multidrug transport system fused ATPase/permease subunit
LSAPALARALLRERRGRAAGVLAAYLSAAAAGLGGPPLLGGAVDRIAAERGVTAVLAAFVAVTGLASVLTWLAGLAGARLSEDLLADLRRRVTDAITGQPVSVVEQTGTGELLTRATADVEAISLALRQGVPWLLISVLTVALTAVALLLVAPLLAAVSLVGAVAAAPAVWWYLRRCGRVYGIERAANARRVCTFHDGVVTAPLTRAYGRTDDRRAGQARADRAWFDAAMAGARLRVVARSGVTVGVAVALAGVVAVGAVGVGAGDLTVGSVTTAVLYLLRVVEPIEVLIHQLDELQTARAAASRVADTIVTGALPVAALAPRCATRPFDGRVRASGVRFAYVPGHEVLHDVDLAVAPGEHVALVGPSGAGKSTLARILAGVHPPDEGSVEVGGVDLRSLDPATLRRWVVMLEQEDHVFAGSVADNLRLVAPDAGDSALVAALDAVGAAWVDDLADGIDTVLGAGRRSLPPVQARQVALARVLLVDPAVVVLDEATAGFDAGSARSAALGLDAALAGRTVISVSHRLDAARRADRIVVVMDGRIAEAGSHDELVGTGGEYASLWLASSAPV